MMTPSTESDLRGESAMHSGKNGEKGEKGDAHLFPRGKKVCVPFLPGLHMEALALAGALRPAR